MSHDHEYWAEYAAARERTKDIMCGCCGVPLMTCPWWQQVRLCANPSQAEARYLDGVAKEKRRAK